MKEIVAFFKEMFEAIGTRNLAAAVLLIVIIGGGILVYMGAHFNHMIDLEREKTFRDVVRALLEKMNPQY